MKFRYNQPVWIRTIKVKGIVKEVNDEMEKCKVTYFSKKEEGKRITVWFSSDDLDYFRKPLTIKVKYFDSEIEKLEKISVGDWVDLRVAEDIELNSGDFKLIPLGVGMKLPKGFEAIVAPRSSTFKKYGVLQANSIGVIDNSYSGNEDQWMLPVYATKDIKIEKNTRICQFRIQRTMPKVNIVEVDNLDDESRGGFGSTGEK